MHLGQCRPDNSMCPTICGVAALFSGCCSHVHTLLVKTDGEEVMTLPSSFLLPPSFPSTLLHVMFSYAYFARGVSELLSIAGIQCVCVCMCVCVYVCQWSLIRVDWKSIYDQSRVACLLLSRLI
ncbi:unnamed protein product [Arctogadus glacialis]